MYRESFDFGWTFFKGKWEFIGFVPQSAPQAVNLPHDATIGDAPDPECPNGASTGYYNGITACYTKTLHAPEDWRGQRILLELDGVYCNAEVAVNGNIVARRPYGYAPFHADLSAALAYGADNEIRVIADNSIPLNSRWYTGTGLYRHVDLLRGGPLRIQPWGLCVHTESVGADGATVVVAVDCRNDTAAPQRAEVAVELADAGGAVAAAGTSVLELGPGEAQTAWLRLWVPQARLWDTETPYLYTTRCAMRRDGMEIDADSTSFGIRTLSLSAANGLCLNGNPIKLRGGCIHHDNGILGGAAYEAADFRKVRLHKEAGYNACAAPTIHPPGGSYRPATRWACW